MRGSRGSEEQGIRTPLKNHKNIGFFSNTVPDRVKNHKATSQHSMLGHHKHANKTPFTWYFTGMPIISRL